MANTIITQNGELVDYCSSISNTGSDPCLNTVGQFNLPAGLSVDSVISISTGVYDPVSGLWQVGQIDGAIDGEVQTETICFKLKVDDITMSPFLVTTTYTSSCTEDPIDNVSACVYDIAYPTITPTLTITPTVSTTSTPTITPTVTPTETKGSCCVEGNCICTDEVGCATIAGTWMGVGTLCADTVCEQSSCFDNVCDARIEKTKRYDLPNYTTPTSTFVIPLDAGEVLIDVLIVSANGTTRQEGDGVYDYRQTGQVIEFVTHLDASGANPCYGQIVYTVECSLGLELGCDCPVIIIPTTIPTTTPTVTSTPTITPTSVASLVLTKTSIVIPADAASLTLVKTSTVISNAASLTLTKTSTVIANDAAELTIQKTSAVISNAAADLTLGKTSAVVANHMADITLAKSSTALANGADLALQKQSVAAPSSLSRSTPRKAKATKAAKKRRGRPKGSKDKTKRKSRSKKK